MSDLFEDDRPAAQGNAPEFTVSELSGVVKRMIEGEFGLVRVRGEVGRVSRPASGHLYFALKDDRASLDAVAWKGQVAKMQVRPEEGMEVIATGRMTTFPGQSKYQLVVDEVAPAGAGALMAMLEARRVKLAAEGLFDAVRKQPIPYLPRVIGVITSPSGAVIRDILHRLRDRFPRPVLIWPVAVQGQACAAEVAAAIRGFNAIAAGGPIPRPDVLIVARGGGSLEDLWGFNEEIVVRAAADSVIPLISAVGHETDTTLIDFAADRRAPTPTAAAEMAVPVRLEVLAAVDARGARLSRVLAQAAAARSTRLRDLARALPRAEALTGPSSQRLDMRAGRLAAALGQSVAAPRARWGAVAGLIRPRILEGLIATKRARAALPSGALMERAARRLERAQDRAAALGLRLAPALARVIAEAARQTLRDRKRLEAGAARLEAAMAAQAATRAVRLDALDRVRGTLGHAETLKRGFAIVRGDGAVETSREAALGAATLELEFADGRLPVARATGPRRARSGGASDGGGQGSLL